MVLGEGDASVGGVLRWSQQISQCHHLWCPSPSSLPRPSALLTSNQLPSPLILSPKQLYPLPPALPQLPRLRFSSFVTCSITVASWLPGLEPSSSFTLWTQFWPHDSRAQILPHHLQNKSPNSLAFTLASSCLGPFTPVQPHFWSSFTQKQHIHRNNIYTILRALGLEKDLCFREQNCSHIAHFWVFEQAMISSWNVLPCQSTVTSLFTLWESAKAFLILSLIHRYPSLELQFPRGRNLCHITLVQMSLDSSPPGLDWEDRVDRVLSILPSSIHSTRKPLENASQMNAWFSGAPGQVCGLARGDISFQLPPTAASHWWNVSSQQEGWMDPRAVAWEAGGRGRGDEPGVDLPLPPHARRWGSGQCFLIPVKFNVFLTDTSQLAVCCQRLVCSTWFAFLIWKPNIFHGFDLVPLGSWDKPFSLSHWAGSNGLHLLHTQH